MWISIIVVCYKIHSDCTNVFARVRKSAGAIVVCDTVHCHSFGQ